MRTRDEEAVSERAGEEQGRGNREGVWKGERGERERVRRADGRKGERVWRERESKGGEGRESREEEGKGGKGRGEKGRGWSLLIGTKNVHISSLRAFPKVRI